MLIEDEGRSGAARGRSRAAFGGEGLWVGGVVVAVSVALQVCVLVMYGGGGGGGGGGDGKL